MQDGTLHIRLQDSLSGAKLLASVLRESLGSHCLQQLFFVYPFFMVPTKKNHLLYLLCI
jgi:hypothetical protein